MVRPCFLVMDREFPASISTRKLVIETAKFNVLTAYSGAEALNILEHFPAINGIVLDAGVKDIPCVHLVRELRRMNPEVPLIVISVPGAAPCPGADYELENFDPTALLGILQKLQPEETAAIDAHEKQLSIEEQES